MLETNKNITLTGISKIEGLQVVHCTATVGTDGGNVSVNKIITNQSLYNANKVECRKDIADFEAEVYEIEDSITTGGTV